MRWLSVGLWTTAAGLMAVAGLGALAMSGLFDSPVPRLVVSGPLPVAAAPLAVLCAFAALLARRRWRVGAIRPDAAAYVLRPVTKVDPRDYVPRYIPDLYIRRRDNEYADADQLAREALRLAAKASRLGPSRLPLGICVFGRPMQGKTRLAWEAMQAELPGWRFLLWPHRFDHWADVLDYCGPRVVLWLDELQTYATPWGAAALDNLFKWIAERKGRKIQIVVVATCRSGADELAVRSQLGKLVDRLTAIWPADLTQEQADTLRSDLAAMRGQQHVGTFDHRSPGSLVLDVEGMQQVYDHVIQRESRHMLWALKLLRSAGIYSYPKRRVLLAAGHFKLRNPPDDWAKARDEIEQREFVRVRTLRRHPNLKVVASVLRHIVPEGIKVSTSDGDEVIEPMSVVYLERIVHGRHLEYSHLSQAWPELLEHLGDQSDAEGLIDLGQAFLTLPHGDLQENRHDATTCFKHALQGKIGRHPIQRVPDALAAAQCGLGDALLAEAELEADRVRLEFLKEAAGAYRVVINDLPPDGIAVRMHAHAQHGLGRALAEQAASSETHLWPADGTPQEESGKHVAESLTGAINAYQAALKLYAETGSASVRAGVFTDLAEAHVASAARVSSGIGAQGDQPASRHLRDAIEAYEAALLLYTPQSTPLDWAKAQQRLGDTLRDLASRVERSDAEELYDQAVSAYHSALSVYSSQSTSSDWAQIQESLGDALFAQANRRDEEASVGDQHGRADGNADGSADGSSADGSAAASGRDASKAEALAKQAKTLSEAVSAYGSALRYFRRELMPMQWAGLTHRLAKVYARYAEIQRDRGHFIDASELLEKARMHLTSSTGTEQFSDVKSAREVREQIMQIGQTIAQNARVG